MFSHVEDPAIVINAAGEATEYTEKYIWSHALSRSMPLYALCAMLLANFLADVVFHTG